MDHESIALHERGLRSLARRLVRDAGEADDIVQDAYVTALLKPPPAHVSLGAWLAGIVRNLAMHRRRAEGRRSKYEGVAPQPAAALAPDEAVVRAECHRALVDAVLALDEPIRTTILLRYFEDLSLGQIAARMRCPVGTVGRRASEGLRTLRARLGREHGQVWPLAISGVLFMKKKLAAIAVVLTLLLTGLVVWDRSPDTQERAVDSDARLAGAASAVAQTGDTDVSPDPVTVIDRDLDLHGIVVDDAGRPIADATLQTFFDPWHSLGYFGTARPKYEDGPMTTSASDGTFALRLRRGQRVNLRVAKDGFSPLEYWDALAGARVRLVMGRGVSLTVLVLDPSGHPAPGTRLRLQELPPSGHLRLTGEATTGADGRGTFVGLPPCGAGYVFGRNDKFGRVPWEQRIVLPLRGETEMTVQFRPGRTIRGVIKDAQSGKPIPNAELDSSWTFGFPSVANADGTFELNGWGAIKDYQLFVRAPGYCTVEVRIALENDLELALEPSTTRIGRVLDLAGQPIAGALVDVRAPMPDGFSTSRGRAVSGADGRFEVAGLVAATPCRVVVFAQGFGKTFLRQAEASNDLGDLTLGAAQQIEGRVLWSDGSPVVGTRVRLESEWPDQGSTVREDRWTDDLGRFRFHDLADGGHQVSVMPQGGKLVSEIVTLAGEPIELTLELESKFTCTARVVYDDGRPVVGCQVMFRSEDKWTFDRSTGSDGRATAFSDTPFTEVSCVYALGLAEPFVFERGVKVPDGGGEVEVRVRRGAIAKGTVLDPEGTPIAQTNYDVFLDGKPMSLNSPFGSNRGFTDMQGNFELVVPNGAEAEIRLAGSVNRVSESQKKLRPFGGSLTGIRAGATDLVLRAEWLRFDRPIVVNVLDPDGNPAPGVQVYAKLLGKLIDGANKRTDADGRVELRGLPEAKCYVAALVGSTDARYADWVGRGVVVLPEGQEITIRLERTLWVRGTIVDADDKPVVDAEVFAYHEQSEIGRTKTDAKGQFALKLRASQKTPFGMFIRAGGKEKRIDPFEPKGSKPITIVLDG